MKAVYPIRDETFPHEDSARMHARRRARERLGIELSDEEINAHESSILSYETDIIGFGARRRELHRVEHGDREFFAVWCPAIRRIVTYLRGPHEWLGSLRRVA